MYDFWFSFTIFLKRVVISNKKSNFILDGSGASETIPPMVAGNAKMRTEIRKAIFDNYDKVNIPDNPNVKFGLTLVNIDVVCY